MKKKGRIEIDQEFCKGCEICMAFCPKDVIVLAQTLNSNGYQPAALTDEEKCTGCAVCAIVCPEVVIEVYRD
jgi:2-oxoglutarate ferredoxin oxidoreductase subunit delta